MSIEQIKQSIDDYNQNHEETLHLVQATKRGEDFLERIAEEFNTDTETVISKTLKQVRSNRKELAADFYLDGVIEEDTLRKYCDQDEIAELGIVRRRLRGENQ